MDLHRRPAIIEHNRRRNLIRGERRGARRLRRRPIGRRIIPGRRLLLVSVRRLLLVIGRRRRGLTLVIAVIHSWLIGLRTQVVAPEVVVIIAIDLGVRIAPNRAKTEPVGNGIEERSTVAEPVIPEVSSPVPVIGSAKTRTIAGTISRVWIARGRSRVPRTGKTIRPRARIPARVTRSRKMRTGESATVKCRPGMARKSTAAEAAVTATATLRKHRNSEPGYQQRNRGHPLHIGILLLPLIDADRAKIDHNGRRKFGNRCAQLLSNRKIDKDFPTRHE